MSVDVKMVLRDNVDRLMQARWNGPNLLRLSRLAQIGMGTCHRIKVAQTAVGLEVICKIAEVFEVEPWQLLVPGLDPAAPPPGATISPQAYGLARELDSIQDPGLHARAHALMMMQLDLVTGGPAKAAGTASGTPAPGEAEGAATAPAHGG